MKIFHAFIFCLMILFAALQWNDPDRGYWILIYLAACVLAMVSFLNLCKSCSIAWGVTLIIACIYMLVPIMPGVLAFLKQANISEFFATMQDNKSYIEQIREFFGLLIIVIYSLITLLKTYTSK